ncbi:MAG: signal peptidase II [Candidatus Omnitrophota bacterium]|nr:MAG: signal peptidase II [Candidatus Omnitrophota bacterium]
MGKVFLIILFVFIDQISKLFALKFLSQTQSIPVISNVLHITLVYNTGSAFGFFQNQNWILIYISIFAIILILFLSISGQKFKNNFYLKIWQSALLLILCGATGNLIDRIRLGYVVDFIDFRVWPVFNFADSMITCGVILLLFIFLKKDILEGESSKMS